MFAPEGFVKTAVGCAVAVAALAALPGQAQQRYGLGQPLTERELAGWNIDVKPDGRVTWRTEVSGTWYTYLALRAFPFDRQRLTVNLALTNFNPAKSFVELVPSTFGTDIFTLGDGDTLSGWDVTDVWVEANPNKTFQSQFVPFRRDRSAPDDPSPLLPAGGGDEGAFGTDIVISSVQVRDEEERR